MTRPPLSPTRRRRWLAGGFLAAVVVLPAAWLAGRQAERRGLAFYEAGRAAVACLGELADALEARDAAGIEAAFAPGFAGRDLGLPGPARPAAEPASRRAGGTAS